MVKSFSAPLNITAIPLAGQAVIGVAECPGRILTDKDNCYRQRNLVADLDAVKAWGAEILISLIEAHEFSFPGIAGFEVLVISRNLRWYHLPIADMGVPGKAFFNSWHAHGPDILRTIEQGGRIVVHCAGGLGRSGMIAAKLMTAFDVPPGEAIARVRKLRSGAIETTEQEQYILNGPDLMQSPL